MCLPNLVVKFTLTSCVVQFGRCAVFLENSISALHWMARHFWLPLMFASLVNTDFSVTRKDKGDYFTRENGKDCNAEGTAHGTGTDSSLCRCNYGLTFSTENNICNDYSDDQQGTGLLSIIISKTSWSRMRVYYPVQMFWPSFINYC